MAGVPANNEQLTDLLANENLQQIQINDDLANQINGNILTMESAKHNSALSKHFKATILNGLDSEMNNLFGELELPDEVKSEILNEQSTFKRVPLLVQKVKALESAKSGASQSDKNDLQKEIDRLNGQIAETNDSYKAQLQQVENEWKNKFLDSNISTVLHGYNYAFETDKSNSVMMAKALLNNTLSQKGLKVIDENGSLKLVKPTEDGSFMDYYDDKNQKVGFKDFADQLLTENNLLKTTDSTPPSTPPPTSPPSQASDKFGSEIERMIAESQS